eukprot:c18683_g1_i4.p2 GENE.c18683_g1_i4~~c18683_g1_i4.p2  ORF type:complete len:101 (+),score=11.25 c18683_g1_i4:621-923(+)
MQEAVTIMSGERSRWAPDLPGLVNQLLNVVLSKMSVAGLITFKDRFCWLELAHCDQLNLCGDVVRRTTGLDAFLNQNQIHHDRRHRTQKATKIRHNPQSL